LEEIQFKRLLISSVDLFLFHTSMLSRLLKPMVWACLLNQLQMCGSFSAPMTSSSAHQQFSVLFANPKTSDQQRMKSKRYRVMNALKSTPKATKQLVSVLGLSLALWRGPMTQPCHAASKNSKSAAIVTPLKVLGRPVAVKGALAVTTGSGAVLTGVKLVKKRLQDPERSRSRHLRKAKREKLKKLKRLTQIRRELEYLLEDATNANLPLMDEHFVEARRQPKSPEEDHFLAMKYAAIKSLADRAYQIILDLGMIEESYVVDLDIIWKLLDP
jgi:hypothetical protein